MRDDLSSGFSIKIDNVQPGMLRYKELSRILKYSVLQKSTKFSSVVAQITVEDQKNVAYEKNACSKMQQNHKDNNPKHTNFCTLKHVYYRMN